MTAAAAIIATLLPQGAATPGQPAGGERAQGGFGDVLAGLIGQVTPSASNNLAAPQTSLLAPTTGTDGALSADADLKEAAADAVSADAAAGLLNLMASTAGAQPAPIAPPPTTPLQSAEQGSVIGAAPRVTGPVTGLAPRTNATAAAETLLQASLAGADEDGAPIADPAPLEGARAPAQAPTPATAAAPNLKADSPQTSAPAPPPALQAAAVPAAISAQINALLNEAQAQPQAQPSVQPTATASAAKSDAKTAKVETNTAITRLTGAVVTPNNAAVEVDTAEAVTAVTGQMNDDAAVDFAAADDKPALAATAPEAPSPMASPIAAAAPILVAMGQGIVKATAQTISHFVDQVAAKTGPKNTQFDIALTPEGLGNVDVKLTITPDGGLTAALSFDTPQAAAELRARAGELQQALTQAGFDISENAISFDVAGQNQGGGNGEAQANYLESLRERANRAVSDLADEASAALANTPYSRPASGQGVDIRI